jgi:hypothetical protein
VALGLNDLKQLLRRDRRSLAADCTRALAQLEGRPPGGELALGARNVARGTLTARLLGIGRDRPWPWALARQTDPGDPGFVPRSMLPVHLNLNYRNWTVLGVPDRPQRAWVDPGGWLTPQPGGPSLAVWIGDNRSMYTLGPLPGWGEDEGSPVRQQRLGGGPSLRSTFEVQGLRVELDTFPVVVEGQLVFGLTARVRLLSQAPRPVRLGFAIRPANPEGVAPIFQLVRSADGWWETDGQPFCFVPRPGDSHRLASLDEGDVYAMVGGRQRGGHQHRVSGELGCERHCVLGQATGVELYRTTLSPGETLKRTVWCASDRAVTKVLSRASATNLAAGARADWEGVLRSGARIELPAHPRLASAARARLLAGGASLSQLSAWSGAMTRLGFGSRVARRLRALPDEQTRQGAFGPEGAATASIVHAIVDHLRLRPDRALQRRLWPNVRRGASWLIEALDQGRIGAQPGYLGAWGPGRALWFPRLWACAALRDAALMARWMGHADAKRFGLAHGDMLEDLRRQMGGGPVAAGPERSMDSAAVSVLGAAWPLGLMSPSEPALQRTRSWIEAHCLHEQGLFHDVVHSGISPALTCWLGQLDLMTGGSGAPGRLDYLVEQTGGSGALPRAFHPMRGGVLGSGDDLVAAAEVALLARNLVVFEEGRSLHLFRGADRRWFDGATLVEGLPTLFGSVDLQAEGGGVRLTGRWKERPRVVWHKPEGVAGVLKVDDVEVRGEGAVLEI